MKRESNSFFPGLETKLVDDSEVETKEKIYRQFYCRQLATVNGFHSLPVRRSSSFDQSRRDGFYQLGLVVFCSDLNSGERGININISQLKREEVLNLDEKVAKVLICRDLKISLPIELQLVFKTLFKN